MKLYEKKPKSQRACYVWKYFESLSDKKHLVRLHFQKNRKKILKLSGWWVAEYDDGTVEIRLPVEII